MCIRDSAIATPKVQHPVAEDSSLKAGRHGVNSCIDRSQHQAGHITHNTPKVAAAKNALSVSSTALNLISPTSGKARSAIPVRNPLGRKALSAIPVRYTLGSTARSAIPVRYPRAEN